MLRSSLCALAALFPLLCSAQTTDALAPFFEGKTVTVKVDMPGSQKGVDVYPDRTPKLDTKSYSSRLRQFGTSLRSGDSVMISKIKIKSDSIEFQLGGGGYGVAGDNTDSSVHFSPADKSQREKDLEDQLKTETDPDKKRAIAAELDDLRRQRARQNRRDEDRARADADRRRDEISSNRVQGGSRFNIRMKTTAGVTPQMVMTTLSEYVYFPPENFGANPSQVPDAGRTQSFASGPPQPPPSAPDQQGGLRKGLTRAQVEQIYGTPVDVHNAQDGSMIKTSATYQSASETVKAQFVNGILVEYSVSSR